jgi:hypothetical protein
MNAGVSAVTSGRTHRWGIVLTGIAVAAPAVGRLWPSIPDTAIPFAVVTAGLATIAALHPRRAWWAVVGLAPVSLALPTGIGGAEVSLPVEPLAVGLALAWLGRLVRPVRLPTTVPGITPLAAITLATLVWTLVSAVFSADPVVAWKTAILRLVGAAGVLGWGLVILEDASARRRLPMLGLLSCSPVAVWALCRWSSLAVSRHSAPQPFFPNRLEFTILCSVWLAAMVGSTPRSRRSFASAILPAISVLALASRAAWAGLAAGLVAAATINAARRPRLLPWAAVAGGAIIVAAGASFGRWWSTPVHAAPDGLESVWRVVTTSVIDRDESLLERLNRWGAAVRMAGHHPIVGFGPGTFERRYAEYQDVTRSTRWSTSRGDLGDAHSELFARLAEEGFPGAIVWFAWLMAIGTTAVAAADGRPWASAGAALGVSGMAAGLSDIPALSVAMWITVAAAMAAAGDQGHRSEPTDPV